MEHPYNILFEHSHNTEKKFSNIIMTLFVLINILIIWDKHLDILMFY